VALSKDQIVQAEDRPTRTENVPEWGGEVILRTMSGAERNAYEGDLLRQVGDSYQSDTRYLYGKLLTRCLIDDNGDRLFDNAVELSQKSAKVLSRLFDIAQEMNGLGRQAVEDAEGNSDAAQSGASTSDSPES
jgi:hypothetical protein